MAWNTQLINTLAILELNKAATARKKHESEMFVLRGKLREIFGDGAEEIIDQGTPDPDEPAYRYQNYRFRNQRGVCGTSIDMDYYVFIGGQERLIEYPRNIEKLEDAANAYGYLQVEAQRQIDRHMEDMQRKDERKAKEGNQPALTTLQDRTVKTLLAAARAVKRTGMNPTDTTEDVVYGFAKNLVALDLALRSIDTGYGDDEYSEDPDQD